MRAQRVFTIDPKGGRERLGLVKIGRRPPRSWAWRVLHLGWLGLALVVSILVCANLVVWGVGRWGLAETSEGIRPGGVALILGAGPGSLALDHRLAAGLELWQNQRVDWLLVSGGGDGTGYSETAYMRRYLERNGVPSESIVEDALGLRTLDSVWRARDLFGVRTVVVVTQRYHLYRGTFLARCAGVETQGFVAENAERRHFVATRGRETLARVRAVLDVITGRGPRYERELEAEWWDRDSA